MSAPAFLAAAPRLGAVRAADRGIASGMERVHRQPVLRDVGVDILHRPVRERVRLPELVALVPAELRRAGTRGGLVAAHARDPAVEAGESLAEGADLADRA